MKKYISFFRIRFINGLQYRAAAYAGMATQFAWGFMTLLMYRAFYDSDSGVFPISFSQMSSYIWLQQSLLALFMAWFFDNDIFNSITSGNVAYELCRPIDLYNMWFVRNVANRLSMVALRVLPIIIVSAILPEPYGLSLPANLVNALFFIISLVAGLLVMVAFNMIIYISAFYTLSPAGMRVLALSVMLFFSGAVIPIPFLPDTIRRVFELLPFASIQNTPFMVYIGEFNGWNIIYSVTIQVFWFGIMLLSGRLLMKNAMKKVIVQGG